MSDDSSDVSSGLVRCAVSMSRKDMKSKDNEAANESPARRWFHACKWSKKDELTILKNLVEFKKNGGDVNKVPSSWLEGVKLDGNFSKTQLQKKIGRVRQKFNKNGVQIRKGHHVYELCSQLWGTNRATPFSPYSIIEIHSMLGKSGSSNVVDDKVVILELYQRLGSAARAELEGQGREIEHQMLQLRSATTQFQIRMVELFLQATPVTPTTN